MAKNRLHITELKQDADNARTHNDRNLSMIAASLTELGTGRSVLVDENNVIIAGNGTVQAAEKVGITKVRIVEASPDEIIAVKRTNLSTEEKRRMAIFDNRTAELAEWDADKLNEIASEGLDLSSFFNTEEIESLARSVARSFDESGVLERDTDDFTQTANSYLHGTIRQIVLYFAPDQHTDVLSRLASVMEREGVENHTEAFLALLEHYEKHL